MLFSYLKALIIDAVDVSWKEQCFFSHLHNNFPSASPFNSISYAFIILYTNFLANPLNSLVRAMWYFSIIWENSSFLTNGWYCTHSNDNTTYSDQHLPISILPLNLSDDKKNVIILSKLVKRNMGIVDINEENIKNLLAKEDKKETKRRVARSVKIFQIIFAT